MYGIVEIRESDLLAIDPYLYFYVGGLGDNRYEWTSRDFNEIKNDFDVVNSIHRIASDYAEMNKKTHIRDIHSNRIFDYDITKVEAITTILKKSDDAKLTFLYDEEKKKLICNFTWYSSIGAGMGSRKKGSTVVISHIESNTGIDVINSCNTLADALTRMVMLLSEKITNNLKDQVYNHFRLSGIFDDELVSIVSKVSDKNIIEIPKKKILDYSSFDNVDDFIKNKFNGITDFDLNIGGESSDRS